MQFRFSPVRDHSLKRHTNKRSERQPSSNLRLVVPFSTLPLLCVLRTTHNRSGRHKKRFTSLKKVQALVPRRSIMKLGFSCRHQSFEWKQQLVFDLDSTSSISQKHHQISKREEVVKEKIILSQEQNIQRLNELVRSLRKQLQQCRNNNETSDRNLSPLTEHVIRLERQQILEN